MENNCAFCDRKNFEERIIAEGKDWYVIATLGQITDGGYALVIPKQHVPCIAAVNFSETLLSAIRVARDAIAKEYARAPATEAPVLMFEHGIVGQSVQHAHLHLLPASLELLPSIRMHFPVAEIEQLLSFAHLQMCYRNRPRPYLLWTTPQDGYMVCWNPPAPLQYLRTAVARMLGRPERGNWRTMDAMLDKRLWEGTLVRLTPYFG